MEEPPNFHKAKSVLPPFSNLQAAKAFEVLGDAVDEDMTEENSKVFQKRDRLFAVLKNAQLDVQHAENLWMIEERLKKIDTL